MAKSEKKSSKKNANTAEPTIDEQTAAFLKSGGKIQQIPTGVSGQSNMSGPKHITLGNKSAEAKDNAKK